MFDTPEDQELNQDVSDSESLSDENTEELEENHEAAEEGEDQDNEEGEQFSEDDAFVVGDQEITPKELNRLKERAKNLESGYTKKLNELTSEFKGRVTALESKATDLEATATTLEKYLVDDEKAIDWDSMTPGEIKETERKLKERRKAIEDAKREAIKAKEDGKAFKLAQANKALMSRYGWKDISEGQKVFQRASKYALSIGYSAERIQEITDTGEFIALIEASEVAEIKSAKPASKKAVKTPSKRIKAKSGDKTSSKSLVDLWYS